MFLFSLHPLLIPPMTIIFSLIFFPLAPSSVSMSSQFFFSVISDSDYSVRDFLKYVVTTGYIHL